MRREYDGEMVSLRGRGIDCLATPDHRVVLQRTQRAPGRYSGMPYPWAFVDARDVPHQVHVPSGGAQTGRGIPGLPPHLLRIIGWVITDGFIHQKVKSRNLGLQQSYSTEKLGAHIVETMDRVLVESGCVGRYERPSRDYVTPYGSGVSSPSVSYYFGEQLSDKLYSLLETDIHRIPRRLLDECSLDQLRSLFDGLMEGDGTDREDKRRWLCLYCGLNEGLADDFQELCVRLGISSLKRFSSQGQWIVNVNERRAHYIRQPRRTQYKGLVWDITVATGAFVARRNGKVFVTGNCPQRIPHGHEAMFGAFDRLVRRGRASGIGVTLISQRAQVINKDVLSQMETLIGMRVLHTLDRKALDAWIEAHDTEGKRDEFLGSLASLGRGDAWIWSPSWLCIFKRIHVRQRETFDSSATPKAGERLEAPKTLAPVDLAQLEVRMESTIERAKADDPRELRKRIAALERELRAKPAAPVDDGVIVRAVDKARREMALEVKRNFGTLIAYAQEIRDRLPMIVPARIEWDFTQSAVAVERVSTERRTLERKTVERSVVMQAGASEVSGGLRRMMVALAQRNGLSKRQMGVRAGLSSTSGTFSTYLSRARQAGWIEGHGGQLSITDAGRLALGSYEPLPSGQGLLDYWLGQLGDSGAARMLRALAARYPKAFTKAEMGEAADISHTSGTFGTYLSRLRTLELIEVSRGEIRASREFFE